MVFGSDGIATGALVSFGANNDMATFTGAVGAATIYGGAGADSLVFSNIGLTGTTLSGGAGADVFSGSVTIGNSGVSFWGGADADTFNFSSFTGAGSGTAYFWNDTAARDSIVFNSVVSGGSGASGNAAGVFFGITSGAGMAISFLDAQTSASFGTGISNLFRVNNSLVSFGIGANDYITLSFVGGGGITLQGFDTAEAVAITNTFGSAGGGTALFGTASSFPTFS
jgi:hypothetical protein